MVTFECGKVIASDVHPDLIYYLVALKVGGNPTC